MTNFLVEPSSNTRYASGASSRGITSTFMTSPSYSIRPRQDRHHQSAIVPHDRTLASGEYTRLRPRFDLAVPACCIIPEAIRAAGYFPDNRSSRKTLDRLRQERRFPINRLEGSAMKIPRVSFTVRRMMVAVAVVALLIGIARLWRTRQLYLEKAADHAGFRALVLRSPLTIAYWESRWSDQHEGKPAGPGGPPFVPARAAYHEAMRLKYERAARYPWLSVPSDPPAP